MRRGTLFWGGILVILGLVFLLDNLGFFGNINIWGIIWPLFLIALGAWIIWGRFFRSSGYHRYATEHDLVVLAVGMEPEVTGVKLPDDIILDSSNFIEGSKDGGMIGAGAASSPLDVNRAVQSATAASLKAIQVIHKTASTEAA